MKKLITICAVVTMILASSSAMASVSLFVDAAPNVYGSPAYPVWEAAARAAAWSGTFVNMANGYNSANIGTTNFEIQDDVVYSIGDLGRRLTWVYYIAGETVDSLTSGSQPRCEVKLENTWDGDYMDFYLDYYGSTWLEPTKWIDYDGNLDGQIDGVIGMAGMAWWAANGVNTQEAVDADIASWGQADETWTFTVKLDGAETSITSYREGIVVPVPGAVLLGGIGVGLVGWMRRRRSL